MFSLQCLSLCLHVPRNVKKEPATDRDTLLLYKCAWVSCGFLAFLGTSKMTLGKSKIFNWVTVVCACNTFEECRVELSESYGCETQDSK